MIATSQKGNAMSFYRKSYEIVAWTYDADIHCDPCTRKRFSDYALGESFAVDSEGNPVHAVFLDQIETPETCGDCHATIE